MFLRMREKLEEGTPLRERERISGYNTSGSIKRDTTLQKQ